MGDSSQAAATSPEGAPTENHHPPGTSIPTPSNSTALAANQSNDASTHNATNHTAAGGAAAATAADPDQEAAQELESELSKLKVSNLS